jgi:hypothetical protein
MFPEDAKNMLIVYEPVEGMSDESRNWKKKQLGYIHRSCLQKASSLKQKFTEVKDSRISEVL